MEKTKHWKISVNVVGVKRKCRKSDRHSFSLGYIDHVEKPDIDLIAIQDKARSMIAENMKEVQSKVRISFLYVESEKLDGYSSETWQMFDKRHFDVELESPVMAQLNA